MSLTMKRYRYLIVFWFLFLWVLAYYWTYRVISINIWNKWEVTTDYFDIENTIDLFDTTQVHEIKVLMTEEEYQDMIDTYANTSEKDWYKTDVIIDGVLISDVGIRLKWNSSLRGMWADGKGWGPSFEGMDRWKGKNKDWKNNMMWWAHGNMKRWGPWGWFPWGQNSSWNKQNLPAGAPEWREDMPFPWAFEGWSFGPWMMSGDSINYDSQLPLFIKFNKYVDQTYQWHEMISLRVGGMGSDATLLAEPYSYELYQEVWQPAPDSSYGSVQIDWKDPELFIISELPEDSYYIQKWFGDDNGILYKAGNFVNFGYLGEDPTLYAEYFTQKTRVNDYDLSPLIRMLKFVTESDDEDFAEHIDDYIDVKSVLTLLAIDDFVWNSDSFGGMWSNYYLYYHLWEQRFYLLTWDQNLAFGWMGGWFGWGGFGWMSWFTMWSWMNFGSGGQAFPNSSLSRGEQDTSLTKETENSSNFPQNDRNNMQMPPDFAWWEMPGNFPGWEFPWGDMPNFPWGEGFEFPWGDFPWGGSWDQKWWFGMNGSNTLKTRLLENEKFKAMYDEIYAQIEEIALNSSFSSNFFSTWSTVFYNYHGDKELVTKSSYDQWLEKLKSYLENKKKNE